MKLFISALTKYVMGILLVSMMLFVPAGSLCFIEAWVFLGLLFIPIFLLGAVLFIKAPHLLKKRISVKEKEKTQKNVVILSALIFTAGFIVAGLDYRFGWSNVPLWVTLLFSLILLVSYGMYAEVMRENAYLSRTVEVQDGQKVIDKGLYVIVRHPMYAVTLWLFISIPVVLGSWWSCLCFAVYIPIIVIRIKNEEKILEEGLKGYSEYKQRVRYRLIPFVW
ncbi:MAG: isoprenylcysteine carboxylmethyltransferase family protein [Ruminococcaceae bacterium]|nr:isoprenylcysteine carboxylmethyltransferase family protein [Oscillospiraceae bacterium]